MTEHPILKIKKVLFVCVENSCRSQIAEAFARIHGRGLIEPYSAGSFPSGQVSDKAIASLAEIGYDLRQHRSKSLADIPQGEYAAVVTMGCGDACPTVQGKIQEDWAIPDPKEMPPEEFRNVRDLIARRVKELVQKLRG